MLSGQTFPEQILPVIGETSLSDEEIKLRCLEVAVKINNVNALLLAMDFYKWVTEKGVS